jgi:hypothetical protein
VAIRTTSHTDRLPDAVGDIDPMMRGLLRGAADLEQVEQPVPLLELGDRQPGNPYPLGIA